MLSAQVLLLLTVVSVVSVFSIWRALLNNKTGAAGELVMGANGRVECLSEKKKERGGKVF